MAPRYQHGNQTYRNDDDIKSTLERIRGKIQTHPSQKTVSKPIAAPRKQSVVKKLATILRKHHAPSATARAIKRTTKPQHRQFLTPSLSPSSNCSTGSNADNQTQWTNTSSESARFTPTVLSPVSENHQQTNPAKHPRKTIHRPGFVIPSLSDLSMDSSNDEASGDEQAQHGLTTAKHRVRSVIDPYTQFYEQEWSDASSESATSSTGESSNNLDAKWIIRRADAKRRDLDPLCFCGFIRAHEHMVQCGRSEVCVGITTNWFHATCVGVTEKNLMKLVANGKHFVCGECKGNKKAQK